MGAQRSESRIRGLDFARECVNTGDVKSLHYFQAFLNGTRYWSQSALRGGVHGSSLHQDRFCRTKAGNCITRHDLTARQRQKIRRKLFKKQVASLSKGRFEAVFETRSQRNFRPNSAECPRAQCAVHAGCAVGACLFSEPAPSLHMKRDLEIS